MKPVLVVILVAAVITSFAQSDEMVKLAEARRGISRAMQQNDLKAARRHAEGAVEISQRLLNPGDRQLALDYENLGIVLVADGKHKLAVEPFRNALRIFKTDPVRNSADILKAMQELGDALSLSGSRKEAESLFSQAVADATQAFGDQSREALNARASRACFYLASNKDKAFSEFGEVYGLTVKKFGKDGPELDEVALICEGSFLENFWKNERFPNLARKKLNEVLGYEIGKPIAPENADYSIRWSDIGSLNRQGNSTIVKVWIDEKGNPLNVKVVYGPRRFSELSTSAARSTKFKPSIQNGIPVSDVMYVPYFFIR